VGIGLSRSSIITSFSLSYDDPFWTDEGVSRGFFLRYQEFDQASANISTFTSSEFGAGVNFGAPITEVDYLRVGFSFRQSDINIGQFRSDFFRIIDPEGDPDDPDNIECVDANLSGICPDTVLWPTNNDPLSHSMDHNGDSIIDDDERQFTAYQTSVTWSRDTLNHFLNPTRGSRQVLTLETTVPGSTRQYYKLYYRYAKYFPIWGDLIFNYHGNVGYGDAYDDYDKTSQAMHQTDQILPGAEGRCLQEEVITLDTGLPFYEHFYGGGVRDIRGFDDNTLGPKDPSCRAVGGDFKLSGGLELAIPTPFTEGGGSRLALFVDVGNVYENINSFDANLLRASAGISITWQAPVGPIIINYSIPLIEKEGDNTENLQFSFGSTF
jgi:outer membrane protein insertion porin family